MNKEQMEDAVRELWLQGGIFLHRSVFRLGNAEAIAIDAQSKLKRVEDAARMYSKPQAIEYLRSAGHIGGLNHEPLRKVEQEWLDRIFVRERCSEVWIGLASVMATAQEQGIHVENHLQVPCRCLDSVERKRKKRSTNVGAIQEAKEQEEREAIIKSVPAFQWQPKKGKRSVPVKLMNRRR